MSSVDKTSEVYKSSKKSLGKYSTEQLKAKLEQNKLVGISVAVANDILTERGAKEAVAKNTAAAIKAKKPVVYVAPTEDDDEDFLDVPELSDSDIEAMEGDKKLAKKTVQPAKVTKTTAPKEPTSVADAVQKVKKEKVIKAPKEKKQVPVGTDVDSILKLDISKSEKIRQMAALGLTVSEIYRIKGFDAHRSFIDTVVRNLKNK
jgi:hypothetical protein